MEEQCDNINTDGNRCLFKAVKNSTKCHRHAKGGEGSGGGSRSGGTTKNMTPAAKIESSADITGNAALEAPSTVLEVSPPITKEFRALGTKVAKECSICLDVLESGAHFLTCNHAFHLECLKGLTSPKCPCCREPITNLPKEIDDLIKNNEEDYKQERIEAERENLARIYGVRYTRPTPQMEFASAFIYLRDLGVYIPGDISPSFPEPQPQQPGAIFSDTIAKIIETIQRRPIDDDFSEDDDNDDLLEYDETPGSIMANILMGLTPNNLPLSTEAIAAAIEHSLFH